MGTLGDLLKQLLAGAITAGHYWKELQRHQNRQRRASDRFPRYDDVVAEVTAELHQRLEALSHAGVDVDRVVLDPGIGFAKEADHNWALLHSLAVLQGLGRPLLIGASRKRFLGALLADPEDQPRPVEQRDYASDAITALAAGAGAWGVRVHDVRGSRDAVAVASAWREGRAP